MRGEPKSVGYWRQIQGFGVWEVNTGLQDVGGEPEISESRRRTQESGMREMNSGLWDIGGEHKSLGSGR